jgi:Uma2 family endonuclease
VSTAARRRDDPTVYREEDDLGEHEIQTYILELLRPLVERYFRRLARFAHVGSDQFVYWKQYDPVESFAPDLYVLEGVPQNIAIDVWKVWEHGGIVPSFVLEVVGKDATKDYDESPKKCAALGVEELVVFDPFPSTRGRRVPLQLFRRTPSGGFHRVEVKSRDRVRSRVLGCFVRVVGTGAEQRIRLATGARGTDLFPTGEEAALARVAELEAQLARRRG